MKEAPQPVSPMDLLATALMIEEKNAAIEVGKIALSLGADPNSENSKVNPWKTAIEGRIPGAIETLVALGGNPNDAMIKREDQWRSVENYALRTPVALAFEISSKIGTGPLSELLTSGASPLVGKMGEEGYMRSSMPEGSKTVFPIFAGKASKSALGMAVRWLKKNLSKEDAQHEIQCMLSSCMMDLTGPSSHLGGGDAGVQYLTSQGANIEQALPTAKKWERIIEVEGKMGGSINRATPLSKLSTIEICLDSLQKGWARPFSSLVESPFIKDSLSSRVNRIRSIIDDLAGPEDDSKPEFGNSCISSSLKALFIVDEKEAITQVNTLFNNMANNYHGGLISLGKVSKLCQEIANSGVLDPKATKVFAKMEKIIKKVSTFSQAEIMAKTDDFIMEARSAMESSLMKLDTMEGGKPKLKPRL